MKSASKWRRRAEQQVGRGWIRRSDVQQRRVCGVASNVFVLDKLSHVHQAPERLTQRSLQPPHNREELSCEASGTETERKVFLLRFNWRLIIGLFRGRPDNAVSD